MEKSQFDTLVHAIAGLNTRFDRSEARADDRFELIKMEFQSVRSEMNARFDNVNSEMNARFDNVNSEMNARFDKVDVRFDRVDSKLDGTYKQVGKAYEEHMKLEARVSTLESPTA